MPSRRRGESAPAAPPKLKPPAAGPTVDTVTAQVAAEPSTEASVVVTVTAPAEGVVMPAYHRVVLSNGTGFQGYVPGGPVPAPDTTTRVDNTTGQTVKVRDLAWSGTSSLSGGVGAPPETDYAPWAASASTRANLAIGYTLAASGALTSVAGSGDARAVAIESSIGCDFANLADAIEGKAARLTPRAPPRMMRNHQVTHLQMPASSAAPDPFQAVADPTRRAILDRLRRGDAPVTELASGFAMSRPAVSKHLRVLREARLVRERRGGADGRQRVYQLTPEPLRDVAQWAMAYEAFWPANLASLKRHLEHAPPAGRALPPRSEERDP